MELFTQNPAVSVEIEHVAPDMSAYKFVTLQGKLSEVTDGNKTCNQNPVRESDCG
jgi:hypothetical protein